MANTTEQTADLITEACSNYYFHMLWYIIYRIYHNENI